MRGNVGDPQLVRPERVEMPFDEVGRALVLRHRARRSGRPGASDTAQAQDTHEPHGRYNGPRDRHRDARRPRVGPASRASCGPPAPSSWFLRTLDISALRASSRRPLALEVGYGGRESGARGDLDSGASEHLADRPGPELLLLGLDVLADQRDGRSHSAAIDKPTRCPGARRLLAALGPLSQAP